MKESRAFFVERKWMTATDVAGLLLVPEDGCPVPRVEPGSHIEVFIERPGQPLLVRQYSLCNGPNETNGYVIAVKLEGQSRGGSKWIHELEVGSLVNLGAIRNLFPLAPAATKHLLLGAGIGITPLLAMAQSLHGTEAEFELHYFARTNEHIALRDRLRLLESTGCVHLHIGLDASAVGQAIATLLTHRDAGTHLYHCGPGPFMDAVEKVAAGAWPAERVHAERFQALPPPTAAGHDTFVVRLHRTGASCTVEAGQSITEALAAAGHGIDVSCEQGVCGTCLTKVIDGTPEHRDAYLSKTEKARGDQMLPCVSRSCSPLLVLDL